MMTWPSGQYGDFCKSLYFMLFALAVLSRLACTAIIAKGFASDVPPGTISSAPRPLSTGASATVPFRTMPLTVPMRAVDYSTTPFTSHGRPLHNAAPEFVLTALAPLTNRNWRPSSDALEGSAGNRALYFDRNRQCPAAIPQPDELALLWYTESVLFMAAKRNFSLVGGDGRRIPFSVLVADTAHQALSDVQVAVGVALGSLGRKQFCANRSDSTDGFVGSGDLGVNASTRATPAPIIMSLGPRSRGSVDTITTVLDAAYVPHLPLAAMREPRAQSATRDSLGSTSFLLETSPSYIPMAQAITAIIAYYKLEAVMLVSSLSTNNIAAVSHLASTIKTAGACATDVIYFEPDRHDSMQRIIDISRRRMNVSVAVLIADAHAASRLFAYMYQMRVAGGLTNASSLLWIGGGEWASSSVPYQAGFEDVAPGAHLVTTRIPDALKQHSRMAVAAFEAYLRNMTLGGVRSRRENPGLCHAWEILLNCWGACVNISVDSTIEAANASSSTTRLCQDSDRLPEDGVAKILSLQQAERTLLATDLVLAAMQKVVRSVPQADLRSGGDTIKTVFDRLPPGTMGRSTLLEARKLALECSGTKGVPYTCNLMQTLANDDLAAYAVSSVVNGVAVLWADWTSGPNSNCSKNCLAVNETLQPAVQMNSGHASRPGGRRIISSTCSLRKCPPGYEAAASRGQCCSECSPCQDDNSHSPDGQACRPCSNGTAFANRTGCTYLYADHGADAASPAVAIVFAILFPLISVISFIFLVYLKIHSAYVLRLDPPCLIFVLLTICAGGILLGVTSSPPTHQHLCQLYYVFFTLPMSVLILMLNSRELVWFRAMYLNTKGYMGSKSTPKTRCALAVLFSLVLAAIHISLANAIPPIQHSMGVINSCQYQTWSLIVPDLLNGALLLFAALLSVRTRGKMVVQYNVDKELRRKYDGFRYPSYILVCILATLGTYITTAVLLYMNSDPVHQRMMLTLRTAFVILLLWFALCGSPIYNLCVAEATQEERGRIEQTYARMVHEAEMRQHGDLYQPDKELMQRRVREAEEAEARENERKVNEQVTLNAFLAKRASVSSGLGQQQLSLASVGEGEAPDAESQPPSPGDPTLESDSGTATAERMLSPTQTTETSSSYESISDTSDQSHPDPEDEGPPRLPRRRRRPHIPPLPPAPASSVCNSSEPVTPPCTRQSSKSPAPTDAEEENAKDNGEKSRGEELKQLLLDLLGPTVVIFFKSLRAAYKQTEKMRCVELQQFEYLPMLESNEPCVATSGAKFVNPSTDSKSLETIPIRIATATSSISCVVKQAEIAIDIPQPTNEPQGADAPDVLLEGSSTLSASREGRGGPPPQ